MVTWIPRVPDVEHVERFRRARLGRFSSTIASSRATGVHVVRLHRSGFPAACARHRMPRAPTLPFRRSADRRTAPCRQRLLRDELIRSDAPGVDLSSTKCESRHVRGRRSPAKQRFSPSGWRPSPKVDLSARHEARARMISAPASSTSASSTSPAMTPRVPGIPFSPSRPSTGALQRRSETTLAFLAIGAAHACDCWLPPRVSWNAIELRRSACSSSTSSFACLPRRCNHAVEQVFDAADIPAAELVDVRVVQQLDLFVLIAGRSSSGTR